MAQTGFTPIQIYRSSTASAAPTSGNLVAGELAINTADGKLFYLDNLNAVQVIGWKLVPTTAGGTGLSSYTTGDTLYSSATNTLAKLPIGSTGQVLTVASGLPAWSSLPAQVYPGAGIPNSTGSAWGTSYGVTGTGSVVLSDAPSLTGAVTIGSTTGTATVTLGQSTGAQTVNIATGTTAASTTKAINIGTAGNATSTTNIAIGSATGTSTTTVNGAVTLSATTQALNLGNSQLTGAINIGGTAGTGNITLGQSTGTQTINIGGGNVDAGLTRTINIGVAAGSSGNSNVIIGLRARSNTTSIRGKTINIQGGDIIFDVTNALTIGQLFNQSVTLVADLPSLTGATVGSRAFITDNLISPIFNAIVTDGEGIGFATPVFYDGTNWRCG